MGQLLSQQYEISLNLVLRPLGEFLHLYDLDLSVPHFLCRYSEICSDSLSLCYACLGEFFFLLLEDLAESNTIGWI